jgi:hypothetical protein
MSCRTDLRSRYAVVLLRASPLASECQSHGAFPESNLSSAVTAGASTVVDFIGTALSPLGLAHFQATAGLQRNSSNFRRTCTKQELTGVGTELLTANSKARACIEKLNSVALVRKRTIPIERPSLVGEVSANFLRIEGCRVVNPMNPLQQQS